MASPETRPDSPGEPGVGSVLWGWSLGLCILTPSLVTLIHSRATGALVMEGGGAWRRAAPRGVRQLISTSQPLDHFLLFWSFSTDFLITRVHHRVQSKIISCPSKRLERLKRKPSRASPESSGKRQGARAG